MPFGGASFLRAIKILLYGYPEAGTCSGLGFMLCVELLTGMVFFMIKLLIWEEREKLPQWKPIGGAPLEKKMED